MKPKVMQLLSIFIFVSAGLAMTYENIADSPAVLVATSPTYPPLARTANVSGDVFVKVSINSKGEVTSSKATGHPLLLKAAEEAAKNWRFGPSKQDEGERTIVLTFTFLLMPRCSNANDLTSVFYPPYKFEVRVEKPEIICDDCSPEERERLRCKNP